jgi:hypothetical protein
MTFYLSARRRVECAILPRLLLAIVNDGGYVATDEAGNPIKGGEQATVERLAKLLSEASWEPLDGLPLVEQAKLARRIDRIAIDIFNGWRGDRAAKYGIAVMAAIRDLHDSGAMLLVDGSIMHQAFEAFAPLLDDALSEDRLAAAGEKKSRHLLRDLRRHGLFAELKEEGQAA